MKKNTLLILFAFLFQDLPAQHIIELFNPSFEDEPSQSKVPKDWINCASNYYSPSDIHPGPNLDQHFGVTKIAEEGDTYVGMVVRDNGTQESIGQKLKESLIRDKSYEITVYLSHSDIYNSYSIETKNEANFNTPTILNIYLGNKYQNKADLVISSKLIEHETWEAYTFEFTADFDANYIVFEAGFNKEINPEYNAYNGNLLIDNCSNIIEIENELFSLKSALRQTNPLTLNAKVETIDKIKTIQKIWEYQESTYNIGHQEFLKSCNVKDFQNLIKALEEVGIFESISILSTMEEIRTKIEAREKLTKEEKKYRKQVGLLLKRNIKYENLPLLLDSYLFEYEAELFGAVRFIDN